MREPGAFDFVPDELEFREARRFSKVRELRVRESAVVDGQSRDFLEFREGRESLVGDCLLYTSDAADE